MGEILKVFLTGAVVLGIIVAIIVYKPMWLSYIAGAVVAIVLSLLIGATIRGHF